LLEQADHLDWAGGPDTAAQMAALHWQAPTPLLEALNARLGPKSVAVEVYANQGRWIVECPDCRGAQLASVADPRFMCNCCGNVQIGGVYRPVVWPKAREQVEGLLADRPRENQNWRPGETVKQLRAENAFFMKGGR
jgi:ribosomal protein L37AE/L43A